MIQFARLQNIPLAFSTIANSERMSRISELLLLTPNFDSRFGTKLENKLPKNRYY